MNFGHVTVNGVNSLSLIHIYTYVLHVHPTLVNGLTCGKGAKELSEQLLGKDVLWIDICKPGYTRCV